MAKPYDAEDISGESEEEEETEDETESEEEETVPRLKPVFVRKYLLLFTLSKKSIEQLTEMTE